MKKTLLSWIVVVLVLALSVPGVAAGPENTQPQPPSFVAGEILLKFKPGTPGQVVAAVHQQNGGQVQRTIPDIDVQVVSVPAGQETSRVAAYASNPNVAFAEVNGFYHATWTPNDPKYSEQWQYGKISAPNAWDVTTGSSTVKIAILDTGIDQSHEDLATKIKANQNFSSSSTVDDKYGHGTHVAGSAAANTNNGTGVAGTCPNCSLMNVKVLGDNGSGSWDGIASGIDWAADNGAKVISMSLGGSFGSSTVEEAVNYAWNKGVVVVAAAGNNGNKRPSYPAYYSNAIAVAATTDTDAKASYSNYGSWVDVAAPGSNILSTAPNYATAIWTQGTNGYGTISGTSMATPHVAGLAGLIWSTNLCTTNSCVRNQIESKADPIAGTGTYWTYGRINAYASVTSGGSSGGTNAAPIAYDQSVTTTQNKSKAITLSASDADGDSLTYNYTSPGYGTLSGTAPNLTYTPVQGYTGADSFTFQAYDGQAYSNTATVAITVKARGGGPSSKQH